MRDNQESRIRRHVGSCRLLGLCCGLSDRAPRLQPTTAVYIQSHPPCERMRVQRRALAVIATLGSPGLLYTQALRPGQFLLRSPTPTVRTAGGAVIGRLFGTSRINSSCSMASSQSGASERGPIILGSKSFTRKMIIEEMGFTPITRSADIDEAAIGDRTADPAELVLQLGLAKAEALLPGLTVEAENGSLGTTLLLTGDQVVVHDGRILEKPADEDEVRRNIAGYARSPCRTVGSAVLTDVVTGQQVSGVDTAEISFSEMPDSVVTKLCEEGTVLQCAGGLMVEHKLVQPYINMDGTIDSVMGLSKTLVLELLARLAKS